MVLRDFGDAGAPELRDFEDVGFVHGGDFTAALACEFEGDAGDADDFGFGIAHGVDGFAAFFVPRARCAEVKTAEEFADEEDIRVLGDLGSKRRTFGECSVGDGGAQVGEASERLPDLEESGFGALVGWECVEVVVPDCA